MKAELVPLQGGPPIPIIRDVTVVGRRDYCDVHLDDESLSKRHCVLVRTDGLLMVRDLATTNGTKVNGQRVMWAALLPNDRLTLGRCKFRVYLGPDDAPSPSEQARAGRSPVSAATARSDARADSTPGERVRLPEFPMPTPDPGDLLRPDEDSFLKFDDGSHFRLRDLDEDDNEPIIDLE